MLVTDLEWMYCQNLLLVMPPSLGKGGLTLYHTKLLGALGFCSLGLVKVKNSPQLLMCTNIYLCLLFSPKLRGLRAQCNCDNLVKYRN